MTNRELACLLSALQAVAHPAFNPHPSQTTRVFESCFNTSSLIVFPPELQCRRRNRQHHFLLSFDLQRRRTASCGLLTAKATRPYFCRAVSTAFLSQWSCLAGERRTDALHLTRSRPPKAALYSCPFNTISPGSCCLSVATMLHLGL